MCSTARVGEVNTADIERCCRELAAAESLSWEWDGRFGVALAVVKKDQYEAVQDLLVSSLGNRWSPEDEIPRAVSKAGGKLARLRSGQIIFATDDAQDPLVFCAWWPWGGNAQASMRVGCWSASGDQSSSLKQWFGL